MMNSTPKCILFLKAKKHTFGSVFYRKIIWKSQYYCNKNRTFNLFKFYFEKLKNTHMVDTSIAYCEHRPSWVENVVVGDWSRTGRDK